MVIYPNQAANLGAYISGLRSSRNYGPAFEAQFGSSNQNESLSDLERTTLIGGGRIRDSRKRR